MATTLTVATDVDQTADIRLTENSIVGQIVDTKPTESLGAINHKKKIVITTSVDTRQMVNITADQIVAISLMVNFTAVIIVDTKPTAIFAVNNF